MAAPPARPPVISRATRSARGRATAAAPRAGRRQPRRRGRCATGPEADGARSRLASPGCGRGLPGRPAGSPTVCSPPAPPDNADWPARGSPAAAAGPRSAVDSRAAPSPPGGSGRTAAPTPGRRWPAERERSSRPPRGPAGARAAADRRSAARADGREGRCRAPPGRASRGRRRVERRARVACAGVPRARGAPRTARRARAMRRPVRAAPW